MASVPDGTVTPGYRFNLLGYRSRYSPDGRYVAFAAGGPGTEDLYIAPRAGGGGRLLAEHTALLDWTRDGKCLIITSLAS